MVMASRSGGPKVDANPVIGSMAPIVTVFASAAAAEDAPSVVPIAAANSAADKSCGKCPVADLTASTKGAGLCMLVSPSVYSIDLCGASWRGIAIAETLAKCREPVNTIMREIEHYNFRLRK
jgi:hypothetical protein